MKLNKIQSQIYDNAYNCLKNAANGKTKDAVKNFANVYELGKDNITMTKLICRDAEKKWVRHEIVDEGLIPGFYPIKRVFNYLKFEFNKQTQAINKLFQELHEKNYPTTYKLRDKLIQNDRVTLD